METMMDIILSEKSTLMITIILTAVEFGFIGEVCELKGYRQVLEFI
ncbi:hypothetical protein [Metabacillus sp. FJAT-52054]|uniref:Uncharacterized protein n=1 Tax=Metabacillus sediminis TaxID=3117746 RepID=A0ABZ2NH39_9BACI